MTALPHDTNRHPSSTGPDPFPLRFLATAPMPSVSPFPGREDPGNRADRCQVAAAVGPFPSPSLFPPFQSFAYLLLCRPSRAEQTIQPFPYLSPLYPSQAEQTLEDERADAESQLQHVMAQAEEKLQHERSQALSALGALEDEVQQLSAAVSG